VRISSPHLPDPLFLLFPATWFPFFFPKYSLLLCTKGQIELWEPAFGAATALPESYLSQEGFISAQLQIATLVKVEGPVNRIFYETIKHGGSPRTSKTQIPVAGPRAERVKRLGHIPKLEWSKGSRKDFLIAAHKPGGYHTGQTFHNRKAL